MNVESFRPEVISARNIGCMLDSSDTEQPSHSERLLEVAINKYSYFGSVGALSRQDRSDHAVKFVKSTRPVWVRFIVVLGQELDSFTTVLYRVCWNWINVSRRRESGSQHGYVMLRVTFVCIRKVRKQRPKYRFIASFYGPQHLEQDFQRINGAEHLDVHVDLLRILRNP
ncbi:hypothetical protein P5673_015527 [Acropora cervicornis]|uniref:Uncharacterized protein n=1 Tax=Acropora cervicornis TaxID=6130 RepID=A0AAD9QIJ3_ACRCE|nr:hypothetical protein P5673_015527 [Acropora cervicornis]